MNIVEENYEESDGDMWVKVLYCTKDQEYAERLTAFFDAEYTNKIELNVCSSMERAMQLLQGIDIFLLGEEFEDEIASRLRLIPCPVAVMVEQVYDNGANNMMQIEKYQRADLIYRKLLDFYAAGSKIKKTRQDNESQKKQKIYVFTSANGGNGTTTIARAFARKCATYEKTLYLDLDMYSMLQMEDGQQHGIDELIMALKSRRNILSLKMNSAIAKCVYGFYSYGTCVNPIDLLEINVEDMKALMDELALLGEYTRIVIDIGTALTERELVALSRADEIIYIMDERDISVQKFGKFTELLGALEKREHTKLLRKISVFRNKVNRDYDNNNWSYDYEVRGWAPYVPTEEEAEIVERVAASDSFHNLEV